MNPIPILDINGPILGLLGVIVTLIANYIIQRKKITTIEQSADRAILSKDQKDFKDSLLKELNECRDHVDSLKSENDRLRDAAINTKLNKTELTEEVLKLSNEIIKLKNQLEVILKKV